MMACHSISRVQTRSLSAPLLYLDGTQSSYQMQGIHPGLTLALPSLRLSPVFCRASAYHPRSAFRAVPHQYRNQARCVVPLLIVLLARFFCVYRHPYRGYQSTAQDVNHPNSPIPTVRSWLRCPLPHSVRISASIRQSLTPRSEDDSSRHHRKPFARCPVFWPCSAASHPVTLRHMLRHLARLTMSGIPPKGIPFRCGIPTNPRA
ncbi:hypothetical protein F4780DRAFT_689165 [Xylariomycetidae sp. FL0641]|nr:hypothetical protein F4780DRAFT_689165 [Xylariomycetidae sp. FL0641]